MTAEQIKQTVAETKAIINGGEYPRSTYREKLTALLEITDHLQKTIEAQAEEIERLKEQVLHKDLGGKQ